MRKEFIDHFMECPIDDLPGFIGDAFDIGVTLEKREDGLHSLYFHNEDFEREYKPDMIVDDSPGSDGSGPEWRFVFVNYLLSCQSATLIERVLRGDPLTDFHKSMLRNVLSPWRNSIALDKLFGAQVEKEQGEAQ